MQPRSTSKSPVRKKSTSKSPPRTHSQRHNTTIKRKVITNNVFSNFADAVGNTPLIKLQGPSKLTGCNIYAKAEYANPGGSVKDRAALYLIQQAEETGQLTPGKPGIIVEATAGNTGLGLSLCANSKGYRTVIVIPETQTKEKKDALRATGAYLIENPALPFKNPNNYVHVARRLSILLRQQLEPLGIPVYYPNQWDNTANARAHEETTAIEIYEQLKSIGLECDGFNAAIGTGGTLVGTSRGLRQLNPNVKIAITDPLGAIPSTYYRTGEIVASSGGSITEGIGQGRVTGNLALENWKPDLIYDIDDNDALNVLNQLNYQEGLQVGLSSGINVAGAIKLAQELGPGHTVVTILADNAMKYASKMYNLSFLRSKNLPIPYWLDLPMGGIDDNNNINTNDGDKIVKYIDRDELKIDSDVNLLPELLGKIDLEKLVENVRNNHEIQ